MRATIFDTTKKPRALDLFCCGGGASRGLAAAGFDVTGVDIEPQPGYPYNFIKADAVRFVPVGYDLVWASPPCQGYSKAVSSRSSKWVTTLGKDEPKLIKHVRALMEAFGMQYVIENVRGARDELQEPFMLCGSMFGLPIQRHRFFEANWPVLSPPHPKCRGIAKDYAAAVGWEYRDMSVTGKGRRKGTAARWKQILGIEPEAAMTQHQLAECIPPAYAEFIGKAWIAAHQQVSAVV